MTQDEFNKIGVGDILIVDLRFLRYFTVEKITRFNKDISKLFGQCFSSLEDDYMTDHIWNPNYVKHIFSPKFVSI